MVGKERALEILETALKHSKGDQTEAVLMAGDSYLTRFATNYIHQNVAEKSGNLGVRVIVGKKIGRASTNKLDAEAIKRAVAEAYRVALLQPENEDFKSLPGPRPVQEVEGSHATATADFSPEERARAVRAIVNQSKAKGFESSGAFSTSATQVAVANSLGVRAYHRFTNANISTVVMSDTSSGYGSQMSTDASEIDAVEVGRVAVAKCAMSQESIKAEPGEYTVILEPEAVGDMMMFLGYLGFSAQAYQEGRSFVCDNLGNKVTGENISIWDDGLDPAGMPLPFDFEGVPKRKVELITNGVARGLVWDSYTAGKEEDQESTGHAIPGFHGFSGPFPLNLMMNSGDSSLEDMVKNTDRGILVTRFHYTNPVHPVKTLITGMTRDGTFLIEGGKVKSAVKNFRFTQSILEALSRVEMISSDRKLVGGFFGGSLVPALKINGFNFTGVTEF